ncbi:MAG: hypothetical protein FJX76_12735 [Armatimonadetes bacterium]|nr:hypothetical protein [Armatimonadota bacterium]
MRLRPAAQKSCLEQDAFTYRKIRQIVPCAFAPVPPGLHPRGCDGPVLRVSVDRFDRTPFCGGPSRELVAAPEEVYFNEHAAQPVLLVAWLN